MNIRGSMNRREIDPELKYCPQCGDEYRADIRSCAACRVELESGRDILGARNGGEREGKKVLEIGPEERVVSIQKGPIMQIKALQSHLLQLGLPSLLVKEEGGGCGCGGPEVILQVRENDLHTVMVALAEEYRQSTGLADHDTRFADAVFDDQAEEVLCPACGYRFSSRETACPDCGLCFA
jgi:hypothetical protein